MRRVANLIPELSFIDHRRKVGGSRLFRTASWLESDYLEPKWKCAFAHQVKPVYVDFGVHIDDGTLLTDPCNIGLEHSFKSILCAQDRSGIELASRTLKLEFEEARHIIDYILLNSSVFKLAEHGLSLITKNDVIALLTCLHGECTAKYNLYQPDVHGTEWLKTISTKITSYEVKEIISKLPWIAEIECEQLLQLCDEELISARCYLFKNGFYKEPNNHDGRPFKWSVNSDKIFSAVYANRILGNPRFVNTALQESLCFQPSDGYMKEYPAANKRTGIGDGISSENSAHYKKVISRIAVISKAGLNTISKEAISVLNDQTIMEELNTKAVGRFAILSPDVVFPAFKNAVEFYLEYGEDILNSYINMVRRSVEKRTSVNDIASSELNACLTPKMKQLGVIRWSNVIPTVGGYVNNDLSSTRNQFFDDLRANKGLKELFHVLLGSIWLIIATLTARRSKEIIELPPERCLIKTGSVYHILFLLRKRNSGEIREEVTRPIPKIVARGLKSLLRLHKELLKLGCNIDVFEPSLFAGPSFKDFLCRSVNPDIYLSRFADYFELPLNDAGERYYPGTHQLRRFFAIVFFWVEGFGGLETLSWFLGHTNIENIWNYITDTTPGTILNKVRANYAAGEVRGGDDAASDLRTLLKVHFGISKFSLMDSDDIADYIEQELIHNNVKIDPVFFETPDGTKYKILIRVTCQI